MSGTGGGIHPNNMHKAHECPYCWCVLYSKGALTAHINKEHWREKEAEEAETENE